MKKNNGSDNNNIFSIDSSSRNKKDFDFSSIDSKYLFNEPKSIKNKKIKKVKENKYIVDNIDNIFSKLSDRKLKLIIQEYILYGIVVLVRIYFWIFLFLTTTRLEQNYCYTSIDQFDSCSFEQICEKYFTSINILLYNHTYNFHDHNFKDFDELLFEENKKINDYFRPFFIRYSNILSKNKIFSKLSSDSSDKTNFAIFMSHKEKWNIFLRYFSYCHYEEYYIMIITMMAFGGILGSIVFGLLSDIYGRRTIIRITLLISTLATLALYGLCLLLDYFYYFSLKDFQNNNKIIGDDSFKLIVSYVYAQTKVGDKFNQYFIFFLLAVLILNLGLCPTQIISLSLIVENSKSDITALVNFRKHYIMFEGLPPILTSILLPNLNNITLTFFILSILDLLAFICSILFFEESIRYYYEYCEWKQLTNTILNTYKIQINDFKTLNEFQLKIFQKKEDLKNFKNSAKKMCSLIRNNDLDNNMLLYKNSFYNDIIDKNIALSRNIKRNTNFIIKLNDVKSNPFLILTSLFTNHSFKKSKFLMLIMLIILYVILHLYQKELLEPPYYTRNDLYLDSQCNYIINSILFIYLIMNIISTYFYYILFRIDFDKIVTKISLVFISFFSFIYHMENIKESDPLINLNNYHFYMMTYYSRDKRTTLLLFFIYLVYFALNGVIFYMFLLMIKISKTIYRCTFLSIYSISIMTSIAISESIYYNMEDYFLFLGILNLLCLVVFAFLSDFKEILFFINDLKIDIFQPIRIKKDKEKND
jgi:MFS family permease